MGLSPFRYTNIQQKNDICKFAIKKMQKNITSYRYKKKSSLSNFLLTNLQLYTPIFFYTTKPSSCSVSFFRLDLALRQTAPSSIVTAEKIKSAKHISAPLARLSSTAERSNPNV